MAIAHCNGSGFKAEVGSLARQNNYIILLQTDLNYFNIPTYRYLIIEKKDEAAGTQALKRLRNTDDIDQELDDIKAEADASKNTTSLSILQLLRTPNLRLALVVTICMHLSQSLTGINAIFYYSTKFFKVLN